MDNGLAWERDGRGDKLIPALDALPGGQSSVLKGRMIFEKRGKYMLHTPILSSSFPFGIFNWTHSKGDNDEILIYPKFEALSQLDLPVGKRYQKEGVNMVSKVGESMDFLACREFQTGDSPKYIHWPSSAKAGKLIVREFQEEYLSRVVMIIDTFVDRGSFWQRFLGLKVRIDLRLPFRLEPPLRIFFRGGISLSIFLRPARMFITSKRGEASAILNRFLIYWPALNPISASL
jgi:hypothetical protein